MTREEQIRELQQSFINGQKYPITFDKFLWRGRETERNCFAYALNLVEGKIEKEWFNVNYFSDLLERKVKDEYTVGEVYRNFLQVFHLIGVKYRRCSLKTKVPKGYYKVAMLIETKDVHWLRQDEDGTWSHKPGWKYKPQNRDSKGRLITDLMKADIHISGKLLEIKYFLIAH